MFLACGPDNVYVGGIENFDALEENTQKKVLAYYEEQGLLYDIDSELERAYADYKENPSGFHSYSLSQSISLLDAAGVADPELRALCQCRGG